MRSQTRKLGALVLAVAVTLSVFGPVGLAAAASQSAGNEALPPGVGNQGVTNATALVDGHREAVNDTGATLVVGSEYALNDSLRYSESTTSTFGEGVSPFRMHTVGTYSDENETVQYVGDQWANETVLLTKVASGNQTEYYKQYLDSTAGPDGPFTDEFPRRYVEEQATGVTLIETTLALGNFTVASTERVGGENLTTLRASEANETEFNGTASITEFDATIVVNEDGRVRSLNTTLSYGTDDFDLTYGYDLELIATGDTDPLVPLWSDEAVTQIGASLDMNSTDDYFELTNYGPDDLPANSTVEATHDNATTNLTLTDGLAENESVYIYYPGEGEPPALSATPPAPENTTLAGEYEFVVRTAEGQELLAAGFGFYSGNETDVNALGGVPEPLRRAAPTG